MGVPVYRVASIEQVPRGGYKVIYFRNKEIVILNHNNRYYALDNLCPHRQAALCHGEISDGALVCPWHGARFELETGKGLPGPHQTDIGSYTVTSENGDILLSERG